ncbi:MAG: NAD(P)H-binding protein [Gammaproteobacteria bacterium]|nr:NAD(P)H-binding protein [Gammaproteobacteria bacterium]
MDVRSVLVICADTDTGYRITQLACRAGLNAIAVVRPSTDPGMYQRLGAEVLKANPTKREHIAALFANLNIDGLAVASIVGGSPLMNSAGNMNVINAAHDAGVKRFVLVTSIGCGDSSGAVDDFVKAFVGKALTAKSWAERALQGTFMDWTIIRAGGMLRRNFKGGAILLDSNTVSGHINPSDLGDAVYKALMSGKTISRVLAAVDAGQAVELNGDPLVAVEL